MVRDTRSGRVGTVIHEFEVPPLDQLRVSTPVLSDTPKRERSAEGLPGGNLQVFARREFATGTSVYCQFEVYGAKKDENTGMPQVTQGYVVRRPDGSVMTASEPSVIKPTSLGQVTRLFGFRLEGAEPGDYEIVMIVRDDIAGNSFEIREPFKVGDPLPASWLSYAALDVELLIDLGAELEQILVSKGKLDWAREEFAALVGNSHGTITPK